MANRYEKIWNAIKKKGPNKDVEVRCRPGKIDTIVLAVKKIKSAEQTARETLELPRYGRLRVRRVLDAKDSTLGAKIVFKLLSPELVENL